MKRAVSELEFKHNKAGVSASAQKDPEIPRHSLPATLRMLGLNPRRDSNPRPSGPHQGFSVRSLLCFSQPRRSRKQDADRLSHCLMSRLAPRPGQTVDPPS
jgi:hypothetical protein